MSPSGTAEDPGGRRKLLLDAIVEQRQGTDVEGDTELVLEGAGRTVSYADGTIRLEVDAAERDSLEDLCAEYHVFKIAQPETRKAPDGVVHLSAVTDAKHAADFLEALFREVYGADPGYELRVT